MFEIYISKITEEDIPDKVKWYNDEEVTKYLHYDEKFSVDKSIEWLKNKEKDSSRYENVIRINENGQLNNIGIIGLFDIDLKNKKAGFYITIGEKNYQGKGLAKLASINFIKNCFLKFNLEKIYLYSDVDNIGAQKLYEKIGFTQEGLLRSELLYKNKFIDRLYYGILRSEYFNLYQSEGDR